MLVEMGRLGVLTKNLAQAQRQLGQGARIDGRDETGALRPFGQFVEMQAMHTADRDQTAA